MKRGFDPNAAFFDNKKINEDRPVNNTINNPSGNYLFDSFGRSLPSFSEPPMARNERSEESGKQGTPAGRSETRIKKNFFCQEKHVRYIQLLSSYRHKGPGSIVDEALEQYFSRPQILSELRRALDKERLDNASFTVELKNQES